MDNETERTSLNDARQGHFFISRFRNKSKPKKNDSNEKKIFTSLKLITLVRCIYAVLVLIYTSLWFWSGHHQFKDIGAQLLLGCVIEIFIFTAISCIGLLRKKWIQAITYLGMLHDTFLAAFVVMLTGYSNSPFLYLFLIIPLYGGIILQRKGGIIGASIVSGVLAIFYFGTGSLSLLVPDAVSQALSLFFVHRMDIANRLISLGLAAYGVGFLTGQLAHMYVKVQANLVESALEFSHLRGIYEHILNVMPIGIVILNPDSGRLLYANPSAKALLKDHIHDTDLTHYLSPSNTPSTPSDFEHSWICQQNDQFLRIARFKLPLDASGILSGYHISDVTEAQKAQMERQKRQRLEILGEFSAKVAHEIRNPLACISGCNEMMQAEELSNEQHQMMEMMGSEIDRLNNLLNDILVFSRRPKLVMESLQPLTLFQKQSAIFLNDKANAGIHITFDIPESFCMTFDVSSLCQILMTLWRNSSEATSGQGEFKVICKDEVIYFMDSGPGLDPEILPKVFEPFFTTKSSGTGLGLAIARQLAMDNGYDLGWNKEHKAFFLKKLSSDHSKKENITSN